MKRPRVRTLGRAFVPSTPRTRAPGYDRDVGDRREPASSGHTQQDLDRVDERSSEAGSVDGADATRFVKWASPWWLVALHEVRELLAGRRAYSTKAGVSCSADSPWPVRPGPRGVGTWTRAGSTSRPSLATGRRARDDVDHRIRKPTRNLRLISPGGPSWAQDSPTSIPGTYLCIGDVLLRQTLTARPQSFAGRRGPGGKSTSPTGASAGRRSQPASAHPEQTGKAPGAQPGPPDLDGAGPAMSESATKAQAARTPATYNRMIPSLWLMRREALEVLRGRFGHTRHRHRPSRTRRAGTGPERRQHPKQHAPSGRLQARSLSAWVLERPRSWITAPRASGRTAVRRYVTQWDSTVVQYTRRAIRHRQHALPTSTRSTPVTMRAIPVIMARVSSSPKRSLEAIAVTAAPPADQPP